MVELLIAIILFTSALGIGRCLLTAAGVFFATALRSYAFLPSQAWAYLHIYFFLLAWLTFYIAP